MPNYWWGYLHKEGTLQVKRFFAKRDLEEARESPFVAEVHGPWAVDSREEALAKLRLACGIKEEEKGGEEGAEVGV